MIVTTGDFVLDASVAAKCFFQEPGSDQARASVGRSRLIAPRLLLLEIASLAAKKVRAGVASLEQAQRALGEAPALVDELVPVETLLSRALEFATVGLSAYDGVYVALAEKAGIPLLTADDRLLRRAATAGMSRHLRALAA